jgi:hypothetical protein
MGWGTRAPVVGWELECERGVKSGVARLGPGLPCCTRGYCKDYGHVIL